MFGEHILVAPVLYPGLVKMDVYLPNSNWFDIDGVKISQLDPSKNYGKNVSRDVDLLKNTIPWFIR